MTTEIFHNMVVSASAELVGMWLLILLGNGVVATCVLNKTKGTNAGWLTICFGWLVAIFLAITVSLAINNNSLHPGWTSKSISGAMQGITINPVGLIIGSLRNIYNNTLIVNSSIYLLISIFAQFTGAFIGQLCVYIIFKTHYNETIDQKSILLTHATVPSIRSYGANFMAEAIATFVLFFAISTISSTNPSNQMGAIVAVVVFGIGLSIGSTTGFALNPTRDLIPRLFHQTMPYKNKGSSDWKYGWIPVLGPLTGGMIALIASPGLLW